VPDTIQDVIAARIDRLPEASKRVLQVASVIGREFSRQLLDRIVEPGTRTETVVRELIAIELIYEKAGLPGLRIQLQACPHAGRRVRLTLGPAPEGASSPDRRDDRGPVRGPTGRAVRGPGAPLREGRGLGQGAGVPHQGSGQGGPGVRHARRPCPVRRGRGDGRSPTRRRSGGHPDGHPPGASRALRPRERFRSCTGRVGRKCDDRPARPAIVMRKVQPWWRWVRRPGWATTSISLSGTRVRRPRSRRPSAPRRSWPAAC
jgi:hypothetical protein